MPVKRSGGGSSAQPKRTRFAQDPEFESLGGSRPTGFSRNGGGSRNVDSGEDDDDDDLDNQYLADDIAPTSRREKKQEKRKLRDTEGYESDSSNDEEGVVPSRRPGGKGDEDGDDEEGDVDMFGGDDEDEDVEGKRKLKDGEGDKGKVKGKNEKEFMDLEDFEGQEFKEDEDDDGDEDDEEDEEQDLEELARQGLKKRRKGTGLDGDMGVDVMPFNMKAEMESGRFTADGEIYITDPTDEGEKHDAWLADVADKAIIKAARRAHREREKAEREREKREVEASTGEGSGEKEKELLKELIGLMERGETVMEALQRIGKEVEEERKKKEAGGGKVKKSWVEKQRERKAQQSEENPFTKLSNIVSKLSNISNLDVYSLSRESIQRMLPTPPQPSAPSSVPSPVVDNRQFQYRFSMTYVRSLPESQRPVEREVFGPFGIMQLRGWKATGFFGPSCENVEVRIASDPPGPWGSWADIIG